MQRTWEHCPSTTRRSVHPGRRLARPKRGGPRMGRMMRMVTAGLLCASVGLTLMARPAAAASARELKADARAALRDLYASQPSARFLSTKAKSVLVFPSMVKAGFMFGGQVGEGVRFEKDKVKGYYSSVAASYGFQAGIQKFGYAIFFMNNAALRQLDATRGFEVGVGP